MRLTAWVLFVAILAGFSVQAECVNDRRSNKNAGILITDFTVTGTQTISASDLARITGDMIGSCFDENSEEMGERVRISFQDRGYFKVEVKSLRFKPSDPLGIPKPGTLEGEISEGARYKLADITFVKNHAFSSETLRQQFPLKRGALFERGKVGSGLQSLRKLYSTRGFLDFSAVPETTFSSNATVNLNLSIQEGPQYHMGKLETVGDEELAATVRGEWSLAEGDVYDRTYIDQFLKINRDSLPVGFSRANVQTIQNCPDAVVEVRLILEHAEDTTSHAEPKNIPCEEHHEAPK